MSDRTMTLRDKILAAAFDALSDFAADVRDAITGESDTADSHSGPGCCEEHRDPRPDAPAVASRTWRGAFASDVEVGALVALDGRHFGAPAGRRALRITDRRSSERLALLGGGEAITFLFVDLDSERPDSITVSPQTALEVAVEVPDSVPAHLDGAD